MDWDAGFGWHAFQLEYSSAELIDRSMLMRTGSPCRKRAQLDLPIDLTGRFLPFFKLLTENWQALCQFLVRLLLPIFSVEGGVQVRGLGSSIEH